MSRSASITNRYCINLHDTLSQETCRNNGKEVITHYVVVKNTPFLINISSKDSTVNFKKTKITASLIYDCEPRREVSLLRSSPLEYVTHLSSNGELVTIEARLHVLTSQYENSHFRVILKFNEEELSTEPLKVISKADNLKKDKNKTSTSNKKKRNASDAFGDTLQRIEQQQQEQKSLIDMLYQQNQLLMSHLQSPPSPVPSVPSSPTHPSSSSHSHIHSVPSPELPISSPSSTDSFELNQERDLHTCISALRSFLNSYKSFSAEDRPNKVRLLNEALSTDEQDTMGCFMTNVLQTMTPTGDCLTLPPLGMELFDQCHSSPMDDQSFASALSTPEHEGLIKYEKEVLGSWLDVISEDRISTRPENELINYVMMG